jgi:steroid 5-alpha reductase family enzyme
MEHLDQFTIITASLVITLAIMCVAFFLALKLKFFSLVDIVWAYTFTVVVGLYTIMPEGWPPRRWVMLGMVTFWSVRLGTHLLTRLKAHYPTEDARYIDLRTKWTKNLNLNFFLFFLFQGLSVLILAIPFLVAALNPYAAFSRVEILGCVVWLCGVIGESVADAQLRRFKADEKNRGRVCEAGLWAYSRHPNYFSEWLLWVGYFLFALPSPNGWVAITSPLLMLYLLIKVTGVPYAEASSLKSSGELYKNYQSRVSRFLPWPPKK